MTTRRKLLTRRLFLQASVLLVAACSSPAATSAPTAAPAAKPTEAPAKPAEAAKPADAAKPAAAASPAAAGAPAAGAPVAANPAAWQKILEDGKKEGKVTMYGSLMGSDEATKLAAAFKADTGIDFDFITVLGGPATTRIREEIKANKAPDIFEASAGWVVGMAPEGVFVSLKDKPLPVWSEPESTWWIHPGYKAPQDWQYVLSRLRPRSGHILANTKNLAAADYPKSWHELATDPKYKGKLAYMDPTATSGLSTEIALQQYVAKSMTTEDVYDMMASQDTLLFKQARANQQSVAQGERAITWPAGDESILNLVTAGAPIKNLYFPEAMYYAMTADMGVLKASQRPNAAMVFINWYLSKQGQEAIGKIQQQASIRRDVPDMLPDALKGEVVGGAKKGQLIVETPLQNKLASDLQSSNIMKMLVDGSPKQAYVDAWNGFLKDWEAKNGGPQDKPVVLQP